MTKKLYKNLAEKMRAYRLRRKEGEREKLETEPYNPVIELEKTAKFSKYAYT